MDRLQGKTCVVTAAGQGIGRAVTELFLREGARVFAVDKRGDLLAGLAPSPRLTTQTLDVTDDAGITAFAQGIDTIDVLVNCVGYVASGTLIEGGLAALDKSYAINVRAMAACIIAFLPAMLARKRGSIVNIASVTSQTKAVPQRAAYATTKAGVIALTKSVALDYVKTGVRCNSISPGTVDTPSLKERMAATGDAEKAYATFVARQPMGRLGRAEEIAAVALFLASDETSFMTGENIVIDGGMSL